MAGSGKKKENSGVVRVSQSNIPDSAQSPTKTRMPCPDPLVSSTTGFVTGEPRKCESPSLDCNRGPWQHHSLPRPCVCNFTNSILLPDIGQAATSTEWRTALDRHPSHVKTAAWGSRSASDPVSRGWPEATRCLPRRPLQQT